MSKKFFSKNFKKAALSLAGVLFAGSLAGSALTLAGRTATADNSLELLYSSSVFNVETGATYKDDTGKSGVKLTTKASGTAAEGASFDFADSFTGDFELDFRVTSANKYNHTATGGWTHYIANGYQKYLFSDYMNPYLDLKEVGITFTSNSNPDKYFTVYVRGTMQSIAFATSASVYVPGDGVYAAGLNFSHFNTTPEEAIWCGYGLNLDGVQAYPGLAEYGANSLAGYQNLLTPIRATTFSNFGATSSGNAAEAPTASNLVKFDAENMKVYVNAGKGGNTYSKQNTTADVLVRDLATNAGYSSTNNIPVGSLSKADFVDGYSVSIAYTDVTANETVGDYYDDAKSKYMFGGYSQYPALETPYDRHASMTIYSVNGNSVSARNTVSNKTQESLVSFDTNEVAVTADSLNAVDNRRGLNFKSVASGTAAEGASFSFSSVMYGDFETDFRVSSEKTYDPLHPTDGWTHYITNTYQKYMFSDYENPYLDLKEVAFTFTSVTDPDKYFKVYFYGAHGDLTFITTAYVYVPGDECYKVDEQGKQRFGYALSSGGAYPVESMGGLQDYRNMPMLYGTSFSNFAATNSKDVTAAKTVPNMLHFDAEEMKIYVNAGTGYSTPSTTTNYLVRDMATNAGANDTVVVGSLNKADFANGYTVSVEFTDVTANETLSDDQYFGSVDHYVEPITTAYDRYANMTIYSVNGQELAYETAGNSQSGIADTTSPVVYAPTTALEPETEVDVTPNFYDVLDGNVIGVYGKVSYSTDGVSFTEIQKTADNKYLFTPSELTTYTFKYEGFKDIAGRKAATLTVERTCELNFAMAVGASIRTAADNTSGIRFEGALSEISYNWLVKTYGAENLKFYYEISANGITKTQQVEAEKIVYDEKTQTYIMRAAIVGLVEEQYDMVFSAKLYVVAGEDTYNATANDNERTIRQVAQFIMADTEYYQSLDLWRRKIIASFANGSAQ